MRWAPWRAAWPILSGWWKNSTRSRSSPCSPCPCSSAPRIASWRAAAKPTLTAALLACAAAAGRPVRRRHRPPRILAGAAALAGNFVRPSLSPPAIPGTRTCSWDSAGGQYSLFANGQLAAVFPDAAGDEVLAAQLLTQHPRPQGHPGHRRRPWRPGRQLLRYPIASLTAVEIDRGYAELIQAHLDAAGRGALADPRLRTRTMDGRRFVLLAANARPVSGTATTWCSSTSPMPGPPSSTATIPGSFSSTSGRSWPRAASSPCASPPRRTTPRRSSSPTRQSIFHTLKSVFPAVASCRA